MDLVTIEILWGDSGEENGARRQAVGIGRRQRIGLAQVDIKDVFSGDGEENKSCGELDKQLTRLN